MIKVVPNTVVCKTCMAKLEFETSDINIKTKKIPKYKT